MIDGLQVRDLSVVVGDQTILAPTTFMVRRSRSLAVVGPSGSGKSTLLSCLTGWRTPTSGEVRVGEQVITSMSPSQRATWRRNRVGVVQQDAHVLEELTVRENVELILTFRRSVKTERGRVGQVMERLGIDRLDERSIMGLSGGERHRVAVARGLVNAEDLLVADEPTASLDRAAADAVAGELIETASRLGAPLVLATHDPQVAARCDEVLDLGAA